MQEPDSVLFYPVFGGKRPKQSLYYKFISEYFIIFVFVIFFNHFVIKKSITILKIKIIE